MLKNRIIIPAFSCFIFCVLFSQSIFARVVDKVLVIVNNEIITQGDINRVLFPIYQRYSMQYTGDELEERLGAARTGILNTLIQDKLLLSEAKRKKIVVKDEEIEAKIDEMRKRFQTDDEFKMTLARENLAIGELRERHKERLMIDKLIDEEIRRNISVSPKEVMIFYDKHKDELETPEKIKLRSILIKAGDTRSPEEAEKLAGEILARLEEGGNFELLAKTYSEGPYRDSGGGMGWVEEGELIESIDNLVFSLNEGEISGILKTDLGFHIFLVEEKEISRPKKFSEAREKIEQILYSRKVEKRLKVLMEELKQNAYIAFR